MAYVLEPGGVIFPAIMTGYPYSPELTMDSQAKAGKLLNLLLSDKQKEEIKVDSCFRVRGGKSSATYLIYRFGCTGNIKKVLFPGIRYQTFCLVISEAAPLEDHLIAQMLLIQFDEDRFLKIARGV
jgi:hypothetical protein